MRWKGRRQSDNVVDRRGVRRVGRKKLGGGAVIVVILVSLFFGKDVSNILGLVLQGTGESATYNQAGRANQSSHNDEASQFVRTILAETEDTWSAIFSQQGLSYQVPKLVLYNDVVQSACGTGSAASGPFYCPSDSQIYIDLSFLQELRKMGAPGDFAFAYVISHEVGHHVQNLVGTAAKVRQQQNGVSEVRANELSVKLELQADCYAGIWINHAENRQAILEQGDIEEGLNAAKAVGDDAIFTRAGRVPRREAFTHGSSAERVHWFTQGARTGDIQTCSTF